MRTVTKIAQLAAVAAICAIGAAAPAHATPATGVTAETLGELGLATAILPPPPAGHLSVPADAKLTLRRIVIAPGGSTGWHHHGGHVQGLVAAGTLTRVLADCTRSVTPAGSWVTEVPVGDHVGLNLGTEPVVLLVSYLLPDEEHFSRDAPARCE